MRRDYQPHHPNGALVGLVIVGIAALGSIGGFVLTFFALGFARAVMGL